MNKSNIKKIAILGAGIGILYWLLKKQNVIAGPGIGLKWGPNEDTGPQTIVYNTTQKLVITAANPTAKDWTYDIEWQIGGNTGARWKNVTIPAYGSIELPWDVIFGPYIIGDPLLDGEINMSDVSAIEQMIVGSRVPNMAADVNLDGVIDNLDVELLQLMILNLNQTPAPVSGIIVDEAGVYDTSVLVKELTTGTTWNIPCDNITIHIEEPTTGILNISSNPLGANIILNGESKGIGPFELILPLGSYSIIAKLEGYMNYQTSAIVTAGVTTSIICEMVPVVIDPEINIVVKWPESNEIPEPTHYVELIANQDTIHEYRGPNIMASALFANILEHLTVCYVSKPDTYWIKITDNRAGILGFDDIEINDQNLFFLVVDQDLIWTY
jgi:hypothetical protein